MSLQGICWRKCRRNMESGPPEMAAMTVSFAPMWLRRILMSLSSSFFASWGFMLVKGNFNDAFHAVVGRGFVGNYFAAFKAFMVDDPAFFANLINLKRLH